MSTIIQLLEESVASFAKNIYQYDKKGDDYVGRSYEDIKSEVYNFAAGLISMGIQKGDRIALLSEGRSDWVVSELGILYTGAINIPLSVLLAEEHDIQFRLEHSGACMIIVSGKQAHKLKSLQNKIKHLKKVIILDSDEPIENKEVYFKDVIQAGATFLNEHQDEFNERWQSVQNDDVANICYTSGTTADPKGIILTHRNYTANVEQSMSIIRIPPHYTTLLILPWDHAFAHTAGVYTLMKLGASMAAVQAGKTGNETRRNIPVNIKDIRPHFLLSVPALAKNFRKNIEKGIREKGKTIESLFKTGLKIAYIYNGNGFNKGKGLKFLLKPLLFIFDKVIFKKVRAGFGGRLKFFIGGGALLDIELQRFFYAIGIPMFQGYGLTEAAPVISANTPDKHKMGSSGILVKYLDLKICDEEGNEVETGKKGEIVVKGENVMAGYWKNEEATTESLKNGWLHTGDLGYMDKDGFLYVLGRFKSLLIGDDGEKYSPEGIEEALTDHSYIIEQCMLFNNQSPYTSILLFPNIEGLKRELKKNDHSENDDQIELALKLLENEIQQYRTGKFSDMFPHRWIPTAIRILPEGFTQDNLMLNSTMKMVRNKIIEHYELQINDLYTPEGRNLLCQTNIEVMKNLLKE